MKTVSRSKPTVSIWIPTKNRVSLLTRAVESVNAQSYPDIQLIIVDDGSSDGTRDYIESLRGVERAGREIIAICNAASRGAASARNQAIERATGTFITGLDDDDYFLPDRVEKFVAHWREDVAGLCTCLIEEGDKYRLHGRQPIQEIDSQRIRYKNFVGNQVFTRTEFLRKIGGFDENLTGWQDYDLWLRLIDRCGPVLKLPYCTYVLDRSAGLARITTSDNARAGFEAFMKKHGGSMSHAQLRHQEINDLHNRSVAIGLGDLLHLFGRDTAARLAALVLKARAPRLYRLIIRATIRLAQLRKPAGFDPTGGA